MPFIVIDPCPVLKGEVDQSAGAMCEKMCIGIMLLANDSRYGSKYPYGFPSAQTGRCATTVFLSVAVMVPDSGCQFLP